MNDKNTKPLFVHKFKTENQHYIYDVNTNRILKAGPLLYDIVDDIGVLTAKEIIDKHAPKYPGALVKEALEHTCNTGNRFFHSSRPVSLEHDLTREDVEHELHHSVEQITLGVTEACNMRCKYCIYSGNYADWRSHSQRSMTWETAKKGIDFLLEHARHAPNPRKPIALGFYGGEPLLEFPLMKKCVQYAQKKTGRPLAITLTTNGTPLNDEMVKFMADNHVYLIVSVDGPREIHDRNRVLQNDKGTFDIVMNNLKKIEAYAPEYYKAFVHFSTVLTPPIHYKALDEFYSSMGKFCRVALVEMYGTDTFGDNPFEVHKSDSHEQEYIKDKFVKAAVENIYNKDHTVKEYRFAFNLFHHTLKVIHTREITEPFNGSYHRTPPCIPGVSKMFIGSGGDFFPCEKVDSLKYFSIGSVSKGVDAGKVHKLLDEFYAMRNETCTNCWAVRLCRICLIHIASDKGFDMEKLDVCCKLFKEEYHKALQLYCSIMEQNPKALEFVEDM